MSYAYPSSTALGVTWEGSSYAYPTSTALGVNWATEGGSSPQNTAGQGLAPISRFGTPLGRIVFTVSPVGAITFIGTAVALNGYTPASLGPTSTVSTAYTPVNQPTSPSSFGPTTQFGASSVTNNLITPIGVSAQPAGFTFTGVGVPAASFTQTAAPAGFSSTLLGTPRQGIGGSASGFTSSLFGTAGSGYRTKAVGLFSTVCGTPSALRTMNVTSLSPRTRFGVPEQFGLHKTYGFRRTWLGHPKKATP